MKKISFTIGVLSTICCLYSSELNQTTTLVNEMHVGFTGQEVQIKIEQNSSKRKAFSIIEWEGPEWLSEVNYEHDLILKGIPSIDDFGEHIIYYTLMDDSGALFEKEVRVKIRNRRVNNDFDGDGKADFLYLIRNGAMYKPLTRNAVFLHYVFENKSGIVLTGFFDDDNKTDLAHFYKGRWKIFRSKFMGTSDFTKIVHDFGIKKGDIPFVGDLNGDGIDELIFRRYVSRNNGLWSYTEIGSDIRPVDRFGGFSTDIPMVADFDGDGKVELAIKRLGTGEWFFKNFGESTYYKRIEFGAEDSDRVAPGDYDGDSKIDPAIRRLQGWLPGHWYVRQSSNDQNQHILFGQQSSDIEIPDDYDGDGKVDRAIYRPTTNEFIVNINGKNIHKKFGDTAAIHSIGNGESYYKILRKGL